MAEYLSVVMPVYNERYLVGECVRRVLAVESPLISRLDLIIVDDGSTDGTREVLRKLAATHPDRITYVEHECNRGKGAAVSTGISHAQGSVTVVQDADLEYNPNDLSKLMDPFVRHGADAVFGSRFLAGDCRRVLYYRHSIANRLLTGLCNLLTDLNFTDMETCYKAVRTRLFQSIPLRSTDFRIEPELTVKLAKRGARIFEVPISYAGRTYAEGKKIGFKDAMLALGAMLQWWLANDLYKSDDHGANILVEMSAVPRFNRWMADTVRPFVGARVLEVGAGLGNLTRLMLPRDHYTVSDVNPHYLDDLRNFAKAKPYMDVHYVDLTSTQDFASLTGHFDTVICLNVLEHIGEEAQAVSNIYGALAPGGRAIILVPQDPRLYGSFDEVLGHVRRYTRESLSAALGAQGFVVDEIFDFNRLTTPGWWFNGRVLGRKHFSSVQLRTVNLMTWVFRRLDRVLPWQGASLIAVARRPESAAGTNRLRDECAPGPAGAAPQSADERLTATARPSQIAGGRSAR